MLVVSAVGGTAAATYTLASFAQSAKAYAPRYVRVEGKTTVSKLFPLNAFCSILAHALGNVISVMPQSLNVPSFIVVISFAGSNTTFWSLLS